MTDAIFGGFDADATDLPELSYGPPEGTYEGCKISNAEVKSDFYKQYEKGNVPAPSNYLVFDISVPGYDYPKSIVFELPNGSAKTWTDEVIRTIPSSGRQITEREDATYKLQLIRAFMRDCGVPDEAMNTAKPGDFIGLEGVLTLVKKGDYVNPARSHAFVVKNDTGVSLPQPTQPAVSVPDVPSGEAKPSALWGQQR